MYFTDSFFIIIVSIGIIVASFYFKGFFKRLFNFFGLKIGKCFHFVFAAAILMLLVLTFHNPLGTSTVVAGYLILFCSIFDLVGLLYQKKFSNSKILRHIYLGGLPAFFVTAVVMILGVYNGHDVVMTGYNVKIEKDFSLRIAYISDIHMGVSVTADNIDEYCKEIAAHKPDIVLLGGDIFDERTSKEDILTACSALGSIESRYGVFFTWGNHEGLTQAVDGGASANIDFIRQEVNNGGMLILDDESVLIDDSFYVVGMADEDTDTGEKTTDNPTELIDKNKPIIMLEHKPINLEGAAKLGVDIYLSGHTHGGQIPPLGFFEGFIYDGVYGMKRLGECTMIVSSGMGTWNTPIRLGSVSEYLIIDINK